VHDFPNNGWRMQELAEGIHYTVVSGEVLLEKGGAHGGLPGPRAAQRAVSERPGLTADRVTRTKYAATPTAAEPPSAAVGGSERSGWCPK
jgi:hypothetical protein